MNWLPRWFWGILALVAIGFMAATAITCVAGQFTR